jgi:hypothetical protein
MLVGYQRCHIGYLTMLEDFPLTPRRCLLFSPCTWWLQVNQKVKWQRLGEGAATTMCMEKKGDSDEGRGVNGKSSSMVR